MKQHNETMMISQQQILENLEPICSILVIFEKVLSQSKSKSKSKVQSPKSKGLGVTLFCCCTTHPPPTQTFLSNQNSNLAQIFTVGSPD